MSMKLSVIFDQNLDKIVAKHIPVINDFSNFDLEHIAGESS